MTHPYDSRTFDINRAKRSGEAARDIYDRESVEYELALYLLQALRELERCRAALVKP